MSSQVEVMVLKQGATALAKNLTVNFGFRPGFVMVFNYKAAARWAIAVDGQTAAAVQGGIKMDNSSTTLVENLAAAAVGSDGITFHDNGIKLGQDADIVTGANAVIVIVAFRGLRVNVAEIDIDGIGTVLSSFGAGKQYGLTSGSLAETGVVKDA